MSWTETNGCNSGDLAVMIGVISIHLQGMDSFLILIYSFYWYFFFFLRLNHALNHVKNSKTVEFITLEEGKKICPYFSDDILGFVKWSKGYAAGEHFFFLLFLFFVFKIFQWHTSYMFITTWWSKVNSNLFEFTPE